MNIFSQMRELVDGILKQSKTRWIVTYLIVDFYVHIYTNQISLKLGTKFYSSFYLPKTPVIQKVFPGSIDKAWFLSSGDLYFVRDTKREMQIKCWRAPQRRDESFCLGRQEVEVPFWWRKDILSKRPRQESGRHWGRRVAMQGWSGGCMK